MLDGIKLGKLIADANQVTQQRIDYSAVFKKYEEEMLPRGREASDASKAAVNAMHKPLAEWRRLGADNLKRK